MRLRSALLPLALGIGIVLAAPSAPALAQTVDTRPGIAVLPFYNGGSFGPNREDLGAWEVGLQQMLLTELAQNEALRVVERSRLRELLDELALSETDRVDPQTAVRIGRLVGARYVVTGSFMDNFGDLAIDARIVNGETGEVMRAQRVRGKREQVYDLLVDLSNRVTRGVRLPALAAQVESERKARAIPSQAVTLYSRALALQDDGDTEGAIQLYRRISDEFPQMTEAREALRQLEVSGEVGEVGATECVPAAVARR
jgi:TolB-like protein